LLCHVYDPPFCLLAPLETKKALSLARRRFLLFQRFGLPVLFACRGRFSAGAFDGIAGMPVSAPAAAAAVVIHSDITKFSSPLNA
jgi:hypothetical protein